MSPAERLLATVTSARWLQMSVEERAVVYDAIHEVVPARLLLASNVGHEAQAFPFFIDQPTAHGFYLIFGQRFVMGASPEEIAEAERDYDRRIEEDEWAAREHPVDGWMLGPPRVVDVAPFFAAEAAIHTALWQKLGAPLSPPLSEALTAIARQGWRLPSEAELELLRILQTHAELPRLGTGLCADDWHDDYAGAPERGHPWGTSAGVLRDEHWDQQRIDRLRADGSRSSPTRQVRPFQALLSPEAEYAPDAMRSRAAEEPMRAKR